MNKTKIAVIIPCFRAKEKVLHLLQEIPEQVNKIYVVDDACPQKTGQYIQENYQNDKLEVIFHNENQGVGGAMITGFKKALLDDMDIMVKLDCDYQMDPYLIPLFVDPIIQNQADYTKGNRFYTPDYLQGMPKIRLFGNAVLSFMTKLSTGYWPLFDPTNGYIAIHSHILNHLPLDKIEKRYFFETDMLFRLNIIRALVMDIPMPAKYENEESSLKIKQIITEFLIKHINRFFKRLIYNYFIRDFNPGTIQLLGGLFLLFLGSIFGIIQWFFSIQSNIPATSGTVMLAALPILLGFNLLLNFINYDIFNTPKQAIHVYLQDKKSGA